jgi:uncharacterized membrane protein YoaT (DUF817 family)
LGQFKGMAAEELERIHHTLVVSVGQIESAVVQAPPFRLLGSFAWNQLLSCVFPIGVFASLALSKLIQVPGLPRYDLILLLCITIQIAMVRFTLETLDELKVICVFHVIGLAMELYKTQIGSWAYPESAYSKLGTVPLYSGFMYASVASYMCQAWRRFDLEIQRIPPWPLSLGIAAAIYANFFANHFFPDIRWILFCVVLIAFWQTKAEFTVIGRRLWMPMTLAFFLIGTFVWVAENLVTFLSGWQYPHQADGWDVVALQKMTSWSLLVIVSFVLVAWLKQVKSQSGQYT